MKKTIFISLIILFLFFLIPITLSPDCDDCLPPCPPCSSECNITCGDTLSGGDATTVIDYYNYSITSSPYMEVNITMTPGFFTDYDILNTSTPDSCTMTACDPQGLNQPEYCYQNLTFGTYILGLERLGGTTYTLEMTCDDHCDVCVDSDPGRPDPNCVISCGDTFSGLNTTGTQYLLYTLSSPQQVDITMIPSDPTTDYDILNESIPDICPTTACDAESAGETEVCGMNLPVGTYILGVEKIGGAGTYDLTLTCSPPPTYELEAWAEGPSFFTIGRPELVSIYAKNLGNVEDTYNVSPIVSSHLIDVNIPSNKIISVEPGRIKNTLGTITLLGPIETGNIFFNVTSETDPNIFFETETIYIRGGLPISLTEFESEGLFQILILASLLLMFYYLSSKH